MPNNNEIQKSFPKGHALRDELSWTHYRSLLKVQNETTTFKS